MLARCIEAGNGAMRIPATQTVVLVLRQPTTEAGSYPAIVQATLRVDPHPGTVASSELVGRFFRKVAINAGKTRPKGYEQTWAPAATHSAAVVPIGGACGEIVATTPDRTMEENTYNWYNLATTPIGGVVYRVTGSKWLVAFQRVAKNLWVKVDAPKVTGLDVAGLLASYSNPLITRSSGLTDLPLINDPAGLPEPGFTPHTPRRRPQQ